LNRDSAITASVTAHLLTDVRLALPVQQRGTAGCTGGDTEKETFSAYGFRSFLQSRCGKERRYAPMMRLRDLLDEPALGLVLLTGAAHLDRPVGEVYTTDLLDPGRYLSGGEIVLTGLMWRRDAADSERFVAALAAAGIAALGAGDAALGSVPADLVAACDRHGVPLFAVPVDVSFRQVGECIAGAGGRAGTRGRSLISAMAAGRRLADLLPQVAAELGVSCWVLTTTGRQVAGAPAATAAGSSPAGPGDAGGTPGRLTDRLGRELAQAFLTADRLPRTVSGGPARRFSLFAVDARAHHRLAAWFLACEGDPAGWSFELRESVDELLTLAALERAKLDEGLRVEERLGAQLAPLLSGFAAPADIRARLAACGLDPDGQFLTVVASITGVPRTVPACHPASTGLAAEVIRSLVPHTVVAALEGEPGDAVLAVLPVAAQRAGALLGTITDGVGCIEPGLRGGRLAVGVSEPATGAAALCRAVVEARHAHRTAVQRATPVAVISAAELSSHLVLLAEMPADRRRLFRGRLVGPLAEYDREHGADLVRTLEAFLACAGSWTRCAERMHVHVNTLRYRVQRIEQITGRDLGRFEDRVDLFLALAMRP
jgi:hypothetical protein